jgi:hypothetical protein
MTPNHFQRLAAVALATTLLAGCGGKVATGPAPDNSDQTAVTTTLTGMPEMVSDDQSSSSTTTSMSMKAGGASGNSAEAAITPRSYWRVIVSAVPHFTIAFGDTDATGRPRQADVLVSRRLLGTFNVLKAVAGDPIPPDPSSIVHKPLDDEWLRYLRLRRFVLPGEGNIWRVVAASGVKVTSANATSSIESVRCQTSDRDTTITDPLQMMEPLRCLHVASGDSLQLTVTTGRAGDVVVAAWIDFRVRFHDNGDGTYSYVFHPGQLTGLRYFGVNVLSNGTLYDDTEPYDSAAWLFHVYFGPRPSNPYF